MMYNNVLPTVVNKTPVPSYRVPLISGSVEARDEFLDLFHQALTSGEVAKRGADNVIAEITKELNKKYPNE